MKIIALILSFSIFVTCTIAQVVGGVGGAELWVRTIPADRDSLQYKWLDLSGDSVMLYIREKSYEGYVFNKEHCIWGFIEERNNVWNTPYLFNAKEFDEETGLYYYGARYYDSRLAMWYGVDALTEKYPNMGGYVYCAGNPVRFVDIR